MGQLFSRQSEVPTRSIEDIAQEVQERRTEVTNLFAGQKLLVLGGDGHGKSSLINTFNHVIRLADPNVVYEEVAEVGPSQSVTKTPYLNRYKKEDSALFLGVQGSNFPVFLDTAGMNEDDKVQAKIVQLVKALAAGKIQQRADTKALLADFKTNFDKMEADEDMAAWTIIFVASAAYESLLALARSVGEAVDQTTRHANEVRVFCILTSADKCKDERKLIETRKDFGEALRIPDWRILQLTNYTATDIKSNGRTKPNFEKDLQVLDAFHRILRKAETRHQINAKEQAASGN